MDTPGYRRLIQTIEDLLYGPPELDELFVPTADGMLECLREGKWVTSPSGNRIRIDQPKHGGGGQVHGHIIGRKGGELGVVNLDGTGSHGTKMTLNRKDAATLRDQGFSIRSNRVVEWMIDPELGRQLLLG